MSLLKSHTCPASVLWFDRFLKVAVGKRKQDMKGRAVRTVRLHPDGAVMLRKDAFGDVKTKTALCRIIPQGYALVKNLFLSFRCDSTAGILHDDMRIAALCGKGQCDGTVHLGEGQGIVQQILKRTCQPVSYTHLDVYKRQDIYKL